jgi:hypothetical protein
VPNGTRQFEAKTRQLDVVELLKNAYCTESNSSRIPPHIVFAVSDHIVGQEVVLPPSIVNDLQGTNQTVFVNPCTSISLPSSCLTTIVNEPVNDFRSCKSYSEISEDDMLIISELFLESVIAPRDLDITVSCLSRPTANVAPIKTPTLQGDTTCSSLLHLRTNCRMATSSIARRVVS